MKLIINHKTGWHGLLAASLLMAAVLVSACTTATYGNKFAPDPAVPDQYSFKIYVGGFQFAPPMEQAEERIREFMAGTDYTSYDITHTRYSAVPSYYRFTVKFSK